jgi:hypothetical protein
MLLVRRWVAEDKGLRYVKIFCGGKVCMAKLNIKDWKYCYGSVIEPKCLPWPRASNLPKLTNPLDWLAELRKN